MNLRRPINRVSSDPKKRAVAVSEKDLQRSIIEYLDAKRLFWYRNNSGATITESGHFVRFGAVGSPDIIVVRHGIYIGIEVKGTGKKQSPEQYGFQEKLERAGGQYLLADSMDKVLSLFGDAPLTLAA